MKKRFLSLMLATCMVAMVLTGCGQAAASGDDAKASVEESKQEDKEETKEESEEETKEETSEEATEEVVDASEESEESKESKEAEESEESTEEVVESTEEVEESEDTDAEVVGDPDIAKMYEGYLEKTDILPENYMMTANTTQAGITMDMTIAQSSDMYMMEYELLSANMSVYISKDKVYCRYNIEGDDVWIWAPVDSTEDAESLTSISDSTLVDPSTVTECVYRETVEEDGVVYDLLDMVIDNGFSTGSATYFVDRETQKIAKCVMEQDGASVVCLIEEIETIELPAEADSATEGTIDDVMGGMMAVIFAGAGMGME